MTSEQFYAMEERGGRVRGREKGGRVRRERGIQRERRGQNGSVLGVLALRWCGLYCLQWRVISCAESAGFKATPPSPSLTSRTNPSTFCRCHMYLLTFVDVAGALLFPPVNGQTLVNFSKECVRPLGGAVPTSE